MFEDLKSKKILITGVTRGIGFATAKLMIEAGAKVTGLGRLEKEDINSSMVGLKNFLYYKCDLSCKDYISSFLNQIDESNFDVLVCNAGIASSSLIFNVEQKDIDSLMSINFFSYIKLSKWFAKQSIKNKKEGSILYISSVLGNSKHLAGSSIYSASKAALSSLAKSMAIEFGSFGIRCNAICPGFVNTDMTKELQNNKKIIDRIPIGRFANPIEIAKCALFFCSDASSYCNGSILTVDGGFSL